MENEGIVETIQALISEIDLLKTQVANLIKRIEQLEKPTFPLKVPDNPYAK